MSFDDHLVTHQIRVRPTKTNLWFYGLKRLSGRSHNNDTSRILINFTFNVVCGIHDPRDREVVVVAAHLQLNGDGKKQGCKH